MERQIGLALLMDLISEGMGKQGLQLLALSQENARLKAQIDESTKKAVEEKKES